MRLRGVAAATLVAALSTGGQVHATPTFTVDPDVGNNTFTAVFDAAIGERITAVSSALGCTLDVDEEKLEGSARCSVPLSSIRIPSTVPGSTSARRRAGSRRTAPRSA
jgi:hypothetical protein